MTEKVRGILRLVLNRNFIIYGIIGLSGALLDFVIYLYLHYTLGVAPVVASFISVSIGIINNFFLNAKYNFRVKDKLFDRLISFYLVGLVGAILSSVMIFFLYDIAGISATLAKVLTIVPVVLAQYIFNKRFAFSNTASRKDIAAIIKTHRWLVVINVVFVMCSLAFIANIQLQGPNVAPDEGTHYGANVKFIIENNRLPESGKDDLAYLKACRDTQWGKVPCTYSYQAYPGANYLISAVGAWFFNKLLDVSLIVGARLVSMLWGLVFINCLYFMIYKISRKVSFANILTACIAFIPQVIFTFSYVNQDAHSLAISAIIGLCIAGLIQAQKKSPWLIASGIAIGGLLPLAKFNYFLVLGVLAVLFITLFVLKKLSLNQILRLVIWSIVGFIVLAAFWYTRNLILYDDLLGQNFTLQAMSKYHELGTAKPLDSHTLQEMFQVNFFEMTFQSFFITFGLMTIFASPELYLAIKLGLAGSLVASLYVANLLPKRDKLVSIALITLSLAIIAGALMLMIYNGTVYDIQPQGRYMYQVIVPLAFIFSVLYSISNRFLLPLLLYVPAAILLSLAGLDLFMRSILTL